MVPPDTRLVDTASLPSHNTSVRTERENKRTVNCRHRHNTTKHLKAVERSPTETSYSCPLSQTADLICVPETTVPTQLGSDLSDRDG